MTKSLSKLCLPALTAALLPAFALAEAQKTPADYQAQLDCASPRNQALLNAAIHPDPRENVWVLEVLNAMGLNRHCPELHEDLFANYLERQAANDIVQEAIGQPATVRDAIEWERRAEYENTPQEVAHDRGHIHRRLLTHAFALEPWTPAAAEIDRLRDAPRLAMIAPGLWVDVTLESASPVSLRLSLSFVNKTARSSSGTYTSCMRVPRPRQATI